MAGPAQSDGFLQSLGEAFGGFLAAIPAGLNSFFGGVGEGAGVHGMFDWVALVLGLALLLSTIRGFSRGRVVGPMLRGVIAVALMGWAVA
jgi:hypothetical protein